MNLGLAGAGLSGGFGFNEQVDLEILVPWIARLPR